MLAGHAHRNRWAAPGAGCAGAGGNGELRGRGSRERVGLSLGFGGGATTVSQRVTGRGFLNSKLEEDGEKIGALDAKTPGSFDESLASLESLVRAKLRPCSESVSSASAKGPWSWRGGCCRCRRSPWRSYVVEVFEWKD